MDKTYRKNLGINNKPRKQTVKRTMLNDGSVSNKKMKLNDIPLQKGPLGIYKSEVKRNSTFANDRLIRLRNKICSEVIPFSTTISSSVLKTNSSSSVHHHRNHVIHSRKENRNRNSTTSSEKPILLQGTSTSCINNDLMKKSSPKNRIIPGTSKFELLDIPSCNTNEDQTHYQSLDKNFEQTENHLQYSSDLVDQIKLKVETTISDGAHTAFSSFVNTNSILLKKKLPVKVLHMEREEYSNFSPEKDLNIEDFVKKKEYPKTFSVNDKAKSEIIVNTSEYPSRNNSSMQLSGRTVGSQNGLLNISIKNSRLGTENYKIETDDLSNDYDDQDKLCIYSSNKMLCNQSGPKSTEKLHGNQETVGSENGLLNISIKNSRLGTENYRIETLELSNDYDDQNKLCIYSSNKMLDIDCTTEPKSTENLHGNQEIAKNIANSRLLKLRSNICEDKVEEMNTPSGNSINNFISCIPKNYTTPKSVYSSSTGKMTSYVQEKLKNNRFSSIQIVNKHNTTRVARPSQTHTLNLSNDNISTDFVTDKTIKCDKIMKESQTNHSPIVYNKVNPFEDSMKYWINYGQIIDSLYEKFFGSENGKNNILLSNNNFSEADKTSIQHKFTNDEIMDWDDADVMDDVGKFSNTSSRCEQNYLKQELYIVVDTNIFLSDLNILKEIVTCGSSGRTKPILYVPWMVLTELDFMKDDKSTSAHLKKKINEAVTFINKTFLEGGRKLIGQNIFEAEQQKHIGKAPDDKIVSCCIQAKQSNLNVILLSNDVNLKNKLLINEIPALSSTEMFKSPIIPSSNYNVPVENEMQDKFQKISEKMGSCCSYIICECAKYAYGDVWNKMDMLQNPPWTLKICLRIFKKYWSSVFRERLLKHCLKTVEQLDAILKGLDSSRNADKFEAFVQGCLTLCIFFKDLDEHEDFVKHIIEDIKFVKNS